MLTTLQLFTCTLSSKFVGYHGDFVELAERLEPGGSILAINSNFAHKTLSGFEKYLKTAKEPKLTRSGAYRKRQGDGSCFSSAIEFVIKIECPGILITKVYKPKFYPSTEEVQVPE